MVLLYANQAPGKAVMTDGSKTVHSATIYWPDHPDGPPPAIDKEKDVFLKFKGEGTEEGQEGLLLWDVTQDGETLRTYNESDIRFSLVYRARLVGTDNLTHCCFCACSQCCLCNGCNTNKCRCFQNESTREEYHKVLMGEARDKMYTLQVESLFWLSVVTVQHMVYCGAI